MTEVTDRDMRAALREAGEKLPPRGPLSDHHRARYFELTGRADTAETVTGADDDIDGPAPDPAMTEAAPRAVPGAPRPRGRGKGKGRGNVAALFKDTARAKPRTQAKPEPARVPTAGVIGSVLSQLAWSARKIPPLQRILYAEAAMAGPIAERASRGTRLDRVVLQPLARNYDKLQVFDALVGVPASVTAIALFGRAVTETVQVPHPVTGELVTVEQPQTDPATGLPVFDERTQAMVMGLRFSLRSWLSLSQQQADAIVAEAEKQSGLDEQVDQMLAWLLAPPQPGKNARTLMREAAEVMTGQSPAPAPPEAMHPPTEPDDRGYLYTPPAGASSAASVTFDQVTANLEAAARSAGAPAPATGSKS